MTAASLTFGLCVLALRFDFFLITKELVSLIILEHVNRDSIIAMRIESAVYREVAAGLDSDIEWTCVFGPSELEWRVPQLFFAMIHDRAHPRARLKRELNRWVT